MKIKSKKLFFYVENLKETHFANNCCISTEMKIESKQNNS